MLKKLDRKNESLALILKKQVLLALKISTSGQAVKSSHLSGMKLALTTLLLQTLLAWIRNNIYFLLVIKQLFQNAKKTLMIEVISILMMHYLRFEWLVPDVNPTLFKRFYHIIYLKSLPTSKIKNLSHICYTLKLSGFPCLGFSSTSSFLSYVLKRTIHCYPY